MKLPKTYKELESSNFFQEHGITDEDIKNQIRLAYRFKVIEAIPEMLKVKHHSEKIRNIRWAYENGVPEAIPEMLEVKNHLVEMIKIRLTYQSGVHKKIEELHNEIKEKYPSVNCFMYCLILQKTLPSNFFDSKILYNHEHCILEIPTYDYVFYWDRHGKFTKDKTNYLPLDKYGLEPIFSLFDAGLEIER